MNIFFLDGKSIRQEKDIIKAENTAEGKVAGGSSEEKGSLPVRTLQIEIGL